MPSFFVAYSAIELHIPPKSLPILPELSRFFPLLFMPLINFHSKYPPMEPNSVSRKSALDNVRNKKPLLWKNWCRTNKPNAAQQPEDNCMI